MPSIQLTKILDTASGVKKDGAAYILPEELDANVFVALGQEILQIPKLGRVEVAAEALVLITQKGDRFFCVADQVVGLRLGGPESKNKHASAGFLTGGSVL